MKYGVPVFVILATTSVALGQGCTAQVEAEESSDDITMANRKAAASAEVLDGEMVIEREDVNAEYMTKFRSARGTCDVLQQSTKIATGVTAVLGVSTVACAEMAGTFTLATLGAGVESFGVCLVPAAGTAAAALTALASNVSYTLVCSDLGTMVVQAVARAGATMKRVVWEGVEYTLACSEYFYDKLTSQKSKYCKKLPSKCTSLMSCNELSTNLTNAHYCRAARLDLWKCWQMANADPQHWNEIIKATTNIQTCYGHLRTKC
jgi:hypothetical protein